MCLKLFLDISILPPCTLTPRWTASYGLQHKPQSTHSNCQKRQAMTWSFQGNLPRVRVATTEKTVLDKSMIRIFGGLRARVDQAVFFPTQSGSGPSWT